MSWVWQVSRDGKIYTTYSLGLIEEAYQEYLCAMHDARYFTTENNVVVDFAKMECKIPLPIKRNREKQVWCVCYEDVFYDLSDVDSALIEEGIINYICNYDKKYDTVDLSIGRVNYVDNTLTETLSIKRVYIC